MYYPIGDPINIEIQHYDDETEKQYQELLPHHDSALVPYDLLRIGNTCNRRPSGIRPDVHGNGQIKPGSGQDTVLSLLIL